MSFGLSLWKTKSMLLVTACVLHTCDRRPSSLQIEFVHTTASFFTRSLCATIFPVVSKWMWLAVGSTVLEYFLVSTFISRYAPWKCLVYFVISIVKL